MIELIAGSRCLQLVECPDAGLDSTLLFGPGETTASLSFCFDALMSLIVQLSVWGSPSTRMCIRNRFGIISD